MESFPSEYEYNSLSSSEEQTKPSLLVKLLPTSSSESSYELTTPLCTSRIKQINPNDLARERGYNIIDTPLFTQLIEVEECENAGSPCSYVTQTKSACRQRYMSIQLRVVSKDKKVSMENFYIPSVCECAFSRNSRDLLV